MHVNYPVDILFCTYLASDRAANHVLHNFIHFENF